MRAFFHNIRFFKIFPLMFLMSLFVTETAYADSVEVKYHPDFGAMVMTDGRIDAISKFPDLRSCLITTGMPGYDLDLKKIDWAKLDNDDEAEICLFRIVKNMSGPEEFLQWLQFHGFETWGPIGQGRVPQVMKDFGYETVPDILGYGGDWKLDEEFPKYPTWGLWRHFIRWRAYIQRFNAQWFPDGKLMQVDIGYLTE